MIRPENDGSRQDESQIAVAANQSPKILFFWTLILRRRIGHEASLAAGMRKQNGLMRHASSQLGYNQMLVH